MNFEFGETLALAEASGYFSKNDTTQTSVLAQTHITGLFHRNFTRMSCAEFLGFERS